MRIITSMNINYVSRMYSYFSRDVLFCHFQCLNCQEDEELNPQLSAQPPRQIHHDNFGGRFQPPHCILGITDALVCLFTPVLCAVLVISLQDYHYRCYGCCEWLRLQLTIARKTHLQWPAVFRVANGITWLRNSFCRVVRMIVSHNSHCTQEYCTV